MKFLIFSLFFSMLFSCGRISKKAEKLPDDSTYPYNTFDNENHLQPEFYKEKFDTLHEWDLGWALLEPINAASKQEEETEFSKRLSPGQKALYFYWYLNDEVTNGGFIQFYWNGYRKYLLPIKDGLKLIGDTIMLTLVEKADKEYSANKDKFDLQRKKDDWSLLYDSLKIFDRYDSIFYTIQNRPMELIEAYARQHPEEFIKLK